MLSYLLDALTSKGFSGRVAGDVDITSGDIGIGSRFFQKCACLGVNTSNLQYVCENCGRTVGDYVWTQSGDGAGSYPVIEIQSPSKGIVGALVVLDSAIASSPTIQEQIAAGEIPESEPFALAKLRAFGQLRALHLGKLFQADEVLIADALDFHNRAQSIMGLTTKEDFLSVIAYSEPMGKTDSARSGNDMLTDMPNSPRPRVLAILPSSLSQLDLIGDEYVVENWPSQILAWRTSMITVEIKEGDALGPISRAAGPSSASESASRKFCTQCGAQLLKQAQKFCQMCGAPAA